MKEPSYSTVLATSWRLVWKHKVLWFLGFFAAFLGQMGLLEMALKIGLVGTEYAFFPAKVILPEFFGAPGFGLAELGLAPEAMAWLLWVFVVIIASFVLLLFVSAIAQGALVHATAQAFRGRKKVPHVEKAWHAGVDHLWRVVFINLIKKVVLLFLALVMASATVSTILDPAREDFFMFIALFILSIIVAMVLSFLAVYAVGYVVVEEYSLGDAIAAAWRMFTRHWLVSLEVGFIILFINIVVGAFVLSSFYYLFVPTIILWVFALGAISPGLIFLGVAAAVTLFLAFVITIGSVLSAFTTTAWTYLFMRMHRDGVKSHVLKLSGQQYK